MSDKFDIKSIDLEIKDDQKGEVAAVFSVFDSLDSDGDIIKSGAIQSGFKSGDVPMVWAHKWDMPIGKGQIVQDEGKATFKGNFFMDTESGKEAYNLVKAMGDLQQWSFGFKVNDSEYGKLKQEGSDEEEIDVRYLKDLTVYEVSPVLVGANQETYTMAIKSNQELLKDVLSHDSIQSEEGNEEVDTEVVEESTPEVEVVEEEVVEEVVEDQPSDDSGDVAEEEGDEEVAEIESVEEVSVEEEVVEEVSEEEAPVEEVVEEEVPVEEVSEEEVSEEEVSEEDESEDEESEEEESEEEVSEEVQKTFSEEVQDALAALGNLIDRAKAISSLRVEDGRKLGAKATEALRTVQDDLSNAWAEIDQFIEEVGTVEASESNLEEQQTEEESSADNSESEDDDFDAQWIEGQRLLAETVDL